MKSNLRTRLKTGDEVVVIAGRDVGKTGTITSIKKNKAFVTGINIVKKHTKPNPQLGITGGICLLYTSPSPRDGLLSRMPSSA